MSSQFIVNSLRDIVPTLEEPYPRELIDYANSLYSLSKVKQALNPHFEVARYHLCSYLTVEKFRGRLLLPEPTSIKIPIPGRKLRSVILDFRKSMMRPSSSPETPPSTPRKRRRRQKQFPTPSSKSFKRQALGESGNPYLTPDSTPSSRGIINLDSKEFSPIKGKKNLQMELLAAAAEDAHDEVRTPKRRGRKPGQTVTISKGPVISTALLVSFCNRFYIQEDTTRKILKTFKEFHLRVKNPWGLLCGLVAISFICLNRDLINNKIGYKSKLYQNLQILQTGGLKMEEIGEWVKIVESLCAEEPWIKELEELPGGKNYRRSVFGIPSLGSFISSSVSYHSVQMDSAYREWLSGIQ
ncbi:DEKNAAC104634 [Brettanomyces naardenensis]|uniref:DEKNAAC104634 n=1 Tax=Brettanomyces naardenensis TaxID=13370 RepID=A0A448YR92_BRENA|nr:DEKNAAC104634 [Brettanomyces naardenensis]